MNRIFPAQCNWLWLVWLLALPLTSYSQTVAHADTFEPAQTSRKPQTLSLPNLLDALERRYSVRFNYQANLLHKLTVAAPSLEKFDGQIEAQLNLLLKPLQWQCRQFGPRSFVLQPMASAKEAPLKAPNEAYMPDPAKATRALSKTGTEAPQLTVAGRVSGQDSPAGIPGVNIVLKGTGTGTVTDAEGNYRLNVPDSGDGILIFSYIGYVTQEVSINQRTQINVTLAADVKRLNEIVVVGYGTQKRSDLTGAVADINQAAVKDLPVATLDQKMIGQVAGVQIQQVSGAPGAGTSVRIRGSGSLGAGNEPLYVVDGMPYSSGLNQNLNPLLFINPNDIESITILKDASSTAIYGSRGANGVVMIKTKQGRLNRTQITASVMRGVQQVPQQGRPKLMNQQEFIDLQRNRIDIAVRRAENREPKLDDYPVEYRNPEQLTAKGTDWYDLLLQTAPIADYNISVNKGTEDSRLNVGLGYFKQDGVLRYTGLQRYSARIGFETNLGKAVTFGGSLQPTYIDQSRTNTNANREDVIGVAIWANPVMSPYDANSNLIPYIRSPQSRYHSAWSFANPLYVLRETAQSDKQFQSLGMAFLEWSILPGLTARSSLNTIWSTSRFAQFVPSTVGGPNRPPVAGTGSSVSTNGQGFNWLIENTLNYKKEFRDHRIEALAGYTAQKNTIRVMQVNAGPYGNDLVQTINAASAINSWGESSNEWSIISYLGRINYSFRDRYLLTATVRSDGSSRFGPKKRYATFPSLAGAWRISEEDFLRNSNLISSLKLRASYGRSGNNNIGDYSHLAAINPGNYVFGTNQVTASFVGLSNPFLTWEESEQIDAGLDGELFGSRLLLTVDFYNRISRNMLLNDVVPGITGFNSQVVNKGSVRNRGVEIALGGRPLTGSLKWDVNANIAFNRNKVLSLNDNGDAILSGNNDNNPTHITVVGKPIGQFFGFALEGVYSDADIANPNLTKTTQVYAGNPKYRDVNGDGVVNDYLDYTIIGNPHPKFTYGLTNNFTFRRFNLGIIVNGQYGGQVMNGLRQTVDNLQGFFNVRQDWVNRWRSSDNPGSGMLYGVPKLTPSWGHRVNSLWVEDASFFRIANLSLGYTFPDKLVKKTGVLDGCRIYMTVQNLAMFTRYEGANPEGQSRVINNTLSPGFDMTSYPLARTTSFGLNFQF